MCCGHSRRRYQAGKTASRIHRQQAATREPSSARESIHRQQASVSNPHNRQTPYRSENTDAGSNQVMLHYLQTSSILVKGPISGRHYTFSLQTPNQLVNASDVESLLRTGFFRKGFCYSASPKTF